MTPSKLNELQERGFALCEGVFAPARLEELDGPTLGRRPGDRAALEHDCVRELVRSAELRAIVEPVLGPSAFAVRAILFDKSPLSNWSVPPHQDLVIAVRERIDAPGFGPWSRKQGVLHVLAPSPVLERMLAVRIHIDRAGPGEGALRLIPDSHVRRLTDGELRALPTANEVLCAAEPGDALVMRPLAIHASSKTLEQVRRRVLHVELAADDLPHGLEWHDRIRCSPCEREPT